MTVKSRIIEIGGSQGIRIPKVLLEQANLVEEVELELQGTQIILRPAHPARHGWEEAFQSMAARGDDYLPAREDLASTAWDDEEWEW